MRKVKWDGICKAISPASAGLCPVNIISYIWSEQWQRNIQQMGLFSVVSMDLPSTFTSKDYFLKLTHYLKNQVPSLLMYAKGAIFMRHFLESESHSVVSSSLWPHGLYCPWNFPGQNTGMGSLSLLQGIFPTQVSCITFGLFTSWATREALFSLENIPQIWQYLQPDI